MIVEIRAAEGGDDAKSLVREQLALYERRAKFLGLDFQVIEDLPGQITARVTGPRGGAENAFRNEGGGHRWQRVPPNEKRGRVHTSTVTVACLPETSSVVGAFAPVDVQYRYDRGSGPGGQNKNKVETRVTALHLPTGLKVVCDVERTQGQNKRLATLLLRARVENAAQRRTDSFHDLSRRRQVGTGMRGDKRRTIRMQDGRVTDHVTGQRWDLKTYLAGEW